MYVCTVVCIHRSVRIYDYVYQENGARTELKTYRKVPADLQTKNHPEIQREESALHYQEIKSM
jgi:hypothetical protein